MTEHCLFAVKGMVPYKIINNKRQQGTTLFSEPKTIHSQKPLIMRTMIEKVSTPPYLELFARQRFTGWDAIGDEL